MKYLRYYKIFEDNKEVEELLGYYNHKGWIGEYTINIDGGIDIDGDVLLGNEKLIKLPFKFKEVTGSFDCSSNMLTSLEGGPKFVGGSFYCNNNKLTTLEFCPESIGTHFNCQYNKLTSLMYLPDVPENLYCHFNKLTSLDTSAWVKGNIYCSDNLFKGEPEFFGECDGKIYWDIIC